MKAIKVVELLCQPQSKSHPDREPVITKDGVVLILTAESLPTLNYVFNEVQGQRRDQDVKILKVSVSLLQRIASSSIVEKKNEVPYFAVLVLIVKQTHVTERPLERLRQMLVVVSALNSTLLLQQILDH